MIHGLEYIIMVWSCSIAYFCADRILKMDATTAQIYNGTHWGNVFLNYSYLKQLIHCTRIFVLYKIQFFGSIKSIVSEKMLLFVFPIGCYMYVKAMPCCEDHLWVPIKKKRTHLVKNHDRNIPANHISCFWIYFFIFSYSPMSKCFRVDPTHGMVYSIQQYDCVIKFVSDFLQVLLFPLVGFCRFNRVS
jgi:hypothetical protein